MATSPSSSKVRVMRLGRQQTVQSSVNVRHRAPLGSTKRSLVPPQNAQAYSMSASDPSRTGRVGGLVVPSTHQAKEPFSGDGQLADVDAEWGKGIGNGVGEGRGSADRPAFADAFEAAERGRGRMIEVDDLDRRYFPGRGDQVVHEACGEQLAIAVVDDFFEQRGADALGHAADRLA